MNNPDLDLNVLMDMIKRFANFVARKPCPAWPACGCGTQSGPHTCEWKASNPTATFLERVSKACADLAKEQRN